VFDDDNLVSCAGLVPVMTLAQQTGLSRLLSAKVQIAASRIKSGAANPAPKLATLIAGMSAGADCIDDVDVLRSGGMKTLFDGVYAPSTVGTLLREFTFGHARQLESVLSGHLVALCQRVDLLPGADARVFIGVPVEDLEHVEPVRGGVGAQAAIAEFVEVVGLAVRAGRGYEESMLEAQRVADGSGSARAGLAIAGVPVVDGGALYRRLGGHDSVSP